MRLGQGLQKELGFQSALPLPAHTHLFPGVSLLSRIYEAAEFPAIGIALLRPQPFHLLLHPAKEVWVRGHSLGLAAPPPYVSPRGPGSPTPYLIGVLLLK